MKKSLLLILGISGTIALEAQVTKPLKSTVPQINPGFQKAVKYDRNKVKGNELYTGKQKVIQTPHVFIKSLTETVIGTTTYDLQSNASVQGRIKRLSNGTIGTTWTISQQLSTTWTDRGTGYNFFDGTSWGASPTARIESQRTGWPAYGTTSAGKEFFICHNTAASLTSMGERSTIGSGSWTVNNITSDYQIWNRMAVGGPDGLSIHVISVRDPGAPYLGLEGALLYYRSLDGGATWDIQDAQIKEWDSTEFTYFQGDAYSIDAVGETIAAVHFGDLTDTRLAKSYDNGNTWTNTNIIDIPFKYNSNSTNTTGSPIGISDVNGDQIADTIENSDGSGWVVLDENGIAHVFFGLMQYLDDVAGDGSWSYFPGWNGVAYWNENFGTNPPIVIGGALDLNGSGQLDVIDPNAIPLYYLSLSSMPSAGIDSNGCIYATYSAMVETLDQGTQNYRHIYAVKSCDGGCSWSIPVDITPNDPFAECVFGSVAKYVDSTIHLVYQRDAEPGLAVRGDLDATAMNDIVHLRVSVTDLSSTIGVALPPVAAASFLKNITCAGDCDGAITVTASCGAPPYAFQWSGGQTAQSLTGLCAGTYTVTVTDNTSNTAVQEFDITDPGAVGATTSIAPISCAGSCDAVVTASGTGGTPPYAYQWNDPLLQTSAAAAGLCPGTYTVIITDAKGCTGNATSGTVTNPAGMTIVPSSANSSCGLQDGSAAVSVSGGTPPYNYLWDSTAAGQTNSTATGLASGSYSVTIADNNGCIQVSYTTVNDSGGPSVTITSNSAALCNGSATGTASASASGGTAPYTYNWNDPQNQTGTNASGLPAGTYSVAVTDSAGCKGNASVTITQPAALVVGISGKGDVACTGDSTGYATSIVTGGTAPYMYVWLNTADSSIVSVTSTVGGLSPGNYVVGVTDANSCTSGYAVTINQLVQVGIDSAVVSDALCYNNGGIDITVSNGSVPYVFSWSNSQTNEDLSNLQAGTYTVTVTDGDGCIISASYSITGPATTLSASLVSVQNQTIDISVSGGTTPYSYLWTGGYTVEDPGPLPAGTYSVTVTDANGCTTTITGINVVGIRENVAGFNTTITPNPSNGVFTIELISAGHDEYDIEIHDIIGKMVFAKSIVISGKYSMLLDISTLPAGIYTVSMKGTYMNKTDKIVKF
ncbi:MAG: T9SS type A sorting domain-containing protein [Bacteroidetes bacterium]|nr:T9SS type A sorting domain-containing protein [Bacteroidota bacterium]